MASAHSTLHDAMHSGLTTAFAAHLPQRVVPLYDAVPLLLGGPGVAAAQPVGQQAAHRPRLLITVVCGQRVSRQWAGSRQCRVLHGLMRRTSAACWPACLLARLRYGKPILRRQRL